jgi:hypothetical protein
LLNIADIFEKVKSPVPTNPQNLLWGQNGVVSQNGTSQNGTANGFHARSLNGNGHHADPYANGASNGNPNKPLLAVPGIRPSLAEAKPCENEPLGLEALLEQIQQGKLELYLHLAPDAQNNPAAQRVEAEEIGKEWMEHPFF